MQLRAEQIEQHLQRGGLKPLYTIHGDEPLQAQEVGDAIRAAARAAGHSERKVYTVSGAHFDWSGLLGAAQAMSLFAERQLIEIRIPGGKPGKDGSEALQRYCEGIAQGLSEGVLTLIHLPKLDWQQQKSSWVAALDTHGVMVPVQDVERRALPAWLAQRLARQGQRVQDGEAGQQTLAFLADQVEGHLLAAHQELQKLALLHGPGVLSFEQVEAAVLNVARYDVTKLVEAALSGQTARLLRVLDGLQAEGETPVMVLWHLADTLGNLRRVRAALDDGRPLPAALSEARIWSSRQRLYERAVPLLTGYQLDHLLQAASLCDGINKGLKQPDWPLEPWDALRRLCLMLVQPLAASPAPRGRLPVIRRLALQADWP